MEPLEPSDILKDIRHSLHELAQPLAAVTGLVDLLILDQRLVGPFAEEMHLISQKLEEVLEIISRIRELARTIPLPEDEDPKFLLERPS